MPLVSLELVLTIQHGPKSGLYWQKQYYHHSAAVLDMVDQLKTSKSSTNAVAGPSRTANHTPIKSATPSMPNLASGSASGSSAPRGGHRDAYTVEEEMDMARYILDSGTEPLTSPKYWLSFAANVSLPRAISAQSSNIL